MNVWMAFIAAALAALAAATRPRYAAVRFTRIPPVVARVNAIPADATPEQRCIRLPTGDDYCAQPGARGHFVLVFDWQVPVSLTGPGPADTLLTVPRLSTTDFASIPRPLHSLISPLNNTIYAAIVHDYLYRRPADPAAAALDRATVDRIFYWGMRQLGVWRPTAGLLYLGVRLAGSWSYRR